MTSFRIRTTAANGPVSSLCVRRTCANGRWWRTHALVACSRHAPVTGRRRGSRSARLNVRQDDCACERRADAGRTAWREACSAVFLCRMAGRRWRGALGGCEHDACRRFTKWACVARVYRSLRFIRTRVIQSSVRVQINRSAESRGADMKQEGKARTQWTHVQSHVHASRSVSKRSSTEANRTPPRSGGNARHSRWPGRESRRMKLKRSLTTAKWGDSSIGREGTLVV
jgi:hypothetical protein